MGTRSLFWTGIFNTEAIVIVKNRLRSILLSGGHGINRLGAPVLEKASSSWSPLFWTWNQPPGRPCFEHGIILLVAPVLDMAPSTAWSPLTPVLDMAPSTAWSPLFWTYSSINQFSTFRFSIQPSLNNFPNKFPSHSILLSISKKLKGKKKIMATAAIFY